MSVFSSNPSTLALQTEQSDVNNDRASLYEIEVLEIVRSTLDRHVARNKDIENPRCPNNTEIW